MNDREFAFLKKKLLGLTSIDLGSYKSQQMRRRLGAYMSAQAPSVAVFCKTLERDPSVLERLTNFLTINVSEFFRDPDHFTVLRTRVLPEIIGRHSRPRIWSAGCSHGGEAYSLAMILEEDWPGSAYRILATDIDDNILAVAREGGPYTLAGIKNVDPALRSKYFTESNRGYKVVESMTRRIEFKRLNLLADRFDDGFDLIVCRNVAIYFSDEAKRRLNARFVDALNPGGVLFIGATETMLDSADYGLERLHTAFYRKGGATVARPTRKTAAVSRS